MPFWSETFGENRTLKDPKRNFRFMVEFQGIAAAQGGASLWYAKGVSHGNRYNGRSVGGAFVVEKQRG